jgi:hypothetical protein
MYAEGLLECVYSTRDGSSVRQSVCGVFVAIKRSSRIKNRMLKQASYEVVIKLNGWFVNNLTLISLASAIFNAHHSRIP